MFNVYIFSTDIPIMYNNIKFDNCPLAFSASTPIRNSLYFVHQKSPQKSSRYQLLLLTAWQLDTGIDGRGFRYILVWCTNSVCTYCHGSV